jgi:7-cyano-7-deazaguanine synthase in queuosine biosynthesis
MGGYEKVDAEIPMRNLLLSMLAVLEGADKVWLVCQSDEMSIPDRSERFFKDSSDLISFLVGRRVVVDTPFRTMDKTDMVAWYGKSGNKIEDLLQTVGCYSYENGYGHCGNCPACFRRWVALMNNDILPGYDLSEDIKDFYREVFSTYFEKRQSRMKEWLFS